MPCFYPKQANFSCFRNGLLKKRLVFLGSIGKEFGRYVYPKGDVTIPCGNCIGCRMERARQWSVRCLHEASLHKNNCFITLTYAPEFLPPGGTLVKEHFQLFMMRLRKRFGAGIRFYHCGEYGDKTLRPHYHALLFNFDFPDKVFHCKRKGYDVYTSESLSELWPFGFHEIGSVTVDSAAYCARYIMKKINGDKAEAHYAGRLPEYTTMSRRPGLGTDWYNEFSLDVFPHDYVVVKGKKCKPPRFYDKLLQKADPSALVEIKELRVENAKARDDSCSPQRLSVREKCRQAKLSKFVRPYEAGV